MMLSASGRRGTTTSKSEAGKPWFRAAADELAVVAASDTHSGTIRSRGYRDMLSVEDNALLTQVGPGTLMGQLMRWYWQPVCSVDELAASPLRTKEIEIL